MTRLPKLPLRLNGQTFDLRLQPPQVGEGTADILRLAGLSDQEIIALSADGVIAALPSKNT